MHNIRAASRKETVFTEQAKSRHNAFSNFAECRIMTMTLVWTGLALWLALNAAVAVRVLVARPSRTQRKPYHGPYLV